MRGTYWCLWLFLELCLTSCHSVRKVQASAERLEGLRWVASVDRVRRMGLVRSSYSRTFVPCDSGVSCTPLVESETWVTTRAVLLDSVVMVDTLVSVRVVKEATVVRDERRWSVRWWWWLCGALVLCVGVLRWRW